MNFPFMRNFFLIYFIGLGFSILNPTYGQTPDSAANKVLSFPRHWLSKMQARIARLNKQLTEQGEQYLQQMASQEQRLQQKLSRVDSGSAQALFSKSARQYAALGQQLKTDTGNRSLSLNGTYHPYLDSLHGSLAYLQQHPELLGGSTAKLAQLQRASSQLQALEARMRDADQIKAYFQQRKQQIAGFIAQHTNLTGLLTKQYGGINREVYYYSQQLRQYKELWNNPDQLEQRALAVLNSRLDYQSFMKTHSSLGSLFQIPKGYSSSQALAGMQTKDIVAQQVTAKASAGGAAGLSALQSNLQSAQNALNSYKAKLSALGAGNGDADMPNFTPNSQHKKTLWRRLEYGVNFQTTRTDYYFPSVSDLGLSLGYRLGHDNVVGIGASYKLGWGNGIQHIAFSGQGIGLRSFLQIKIKGSFSATGGFEYNYTTPFPVFSQLPRLQDWTRSGLIGVTKTITTKGKVLKKTNLSLLWDFLSYSQIPPTQPLLFRVGYTLN